jgi:hypothetical protein
MLRSQASKIGGGVLDIPEQEPPLTREIVATACAVDALCLMHAREVERDGAMTVVMTSEHVGAVRAAALESGLDIDVLRGLVGAAVVSRAEPELRGLGAYFEADRGALEAFGVFDVARLRERERVKKWGGSVVVGDAFAAACRWRRTIRAGVVSPPDAVRPGRSSGASNSRRSPPPRAGTPDCTRPRSARLAARRPQPS